MFVTDFRNVRWTSVIAKATNRMFSIAQTNQAASHGKIFVMMCKTVQMGLTNVFALISSSSNPQQFQASCVSLRKSIARLQDLLTLHASSSITPLK
jgi:hypothetical protein